LEREERIHDEEDQYNGRLGSVSSARNT
jgi:hypothetical protein